MLPFFYNRNLAKHYAGYSKQQAAGSAKNNLDTISICRHFQIVVSL